MKNVINVGIGGRSFSLDADAHSRLTVYLDTFRKKVGMNLQTNEVMEEVEARIADLFTEALAGTGKDVVDIAMVEKVISMLGMPDGSNAPEFTAEPTGVKAVKKFYRDSDDKKIGGVCSGLAAYLDIDVTLVRALALAALICGTLGFWVYIIICIAAPLATTSAQKCEMRGEPATAENMSKYMSGK